MAIKTRKVKFGIVAGWDPSRKDPRGVRVTGKNYLDVVNWVGGKTDAIHYEKDGVVKDLKIKLYTDRGNRVRVAREGDVVVKLDTNCFGVIKEADFLGFEK